MEIKLTDLNTTINELNKREIKSIHIENEYYWNIPSEDLYNPYKNPANLNLGQLSDDWNDLLKVASGADDPLISDFIDLAAILRAIGDLGELYFFTHK